jgi:hypothetical protein
MAIKAIAPTIDYEVTPKPFKIKKELVDQAIRETSGPSGEVSSTRFFGWLSKYYPILDRNDSNDILKCEGRYNAALDRRD